MTATQTTKPDARFPFPTTRLDRTTTQLFLKTENTAKQLAQKHITPVVHYADLLEHIHMTTVTTPSDPTQLPTRQSNRDRRTYDVGQIGRIRDTRTYDYTGQWPEDTLNK